MPTTTGTYKVLVTNASGCSKFSTSTVVTVNALPTATVTASGPLTFCAGDSVKLTANAGTGLTYKWRKGSANITGATLIAYTAKTAGTYRVVVTNAAGCTKSSSTRKVVINCKTEGSTFEESNNSISVYPNPANGPFNIALINDEMESGIAQVTVMNILGENVFTGEALFENGSFSKSIDLGDKRSKGLYMIRVTLNGAVYTNRIVVQ